MCGLARGPDRRLRHSAWLGWEFWSAAWTPLAARAAIRGYQPSPCCLDAIPPATNALGFPTSTAGRLPLATGLVLVGEPLGTGGAC
jgi:hypothetical protein